MRVTGYVVVALSLVGFVSCAVAGDEFGPSVDAGEEVGRVDGEDRDVLEDETPVAEDGGGLDEPLGDSGGERDDESLGDPDADLREELESDPGEAAEEVEVGGPAPLYDEVEVYSTTIAGTGHQADVYYPVVDGTSDSDRIVPLALVLQGANVDKSFYSGVAEIVAGHGFVVVVPNHQGINIMGPGLYPTPQSVNAVLAHMTSENLGPSPVEGLIDVSILVLLGHSYGGVVGLHSIQGLCQLPFCLGSFERPEALAGGVFYGTNLRSPLGGAIPAVENEGSPIAFVQGDRDGLATAADAQTTYERVVDPPRALFTLLGANHYGVCDVDNPEGANRDESAPEMEQDVAVSVTGTLVASFLRAYVLGESEVSAYLESDASADLGVGVQLVH